MRQGLTGNTLPKMRALTAHIAVFGLRIDPTEHFSFDPFHVFANVMPFGRRQSIQPIMPFFAPKTAI
jgi:hypothetical protein